MAVCRGTSFVVEKILPQVALELRTASSEGQCLT